MHLVQLLLPIRDRRGEAFPRRQYDDLAERLTETFGGVTAYTRSPASGLWEAESGTTVRDDVVVYEVMADRLDAAWWKELRVALEKAFQQDELVIRALDIRRL